MCLCLRSSIHLSNLCHGCGEHVSFGSAIAWHVASNDMLNRFDDWYAFASRTCRDTMLCAARFAHPCDRNLVPTILPAECYLFERTYLNLNRFAYEFTRTRLIAHCSLLLSGNAWAGDKCVRHAFAQWATQQKRRHHAGGMWLEQKKGKWKICVNATKAIDRMWHWFRLSHKWMNQSYLPRPYSHTAGHAQHYSIFYFTFLSMHIDCSEANQLA